MLDRIREKMPTVPEDLGEYARVHTGPGSWSADTIFARVSEVTDHATPTAPYVSLSIDDLTDR